MMLTMESLNQEEEKLIMKRMRNHSLRELEHEVTFPLHRFEMEAKPPSVSDEEVKATETFHSDPRVGVLRGTVELVLLAKGYLVVNVSVF
ncbi:hypothetical protein TIFTF001_044663 [Ficus carica]|uniref:Uncharacterized protein n=1 Tax=Ficus carica TaxID=3494 RepID=A0AA87ZU50_FICCA|nr:hypothetical protein TIFTF001_044663 [Ficus carica]